MTSPTQLTLKRCRELDWPVQVTEQWIAFKGSRGGIRKDLFGAIDLVAMTDFGQACTLGIQACAATDMSKRMKKAAAIPEITGCRADPDGAPWIKPHWAQEQSHRMFEVWAWGLRGPAGKRKLWVLTIKRWYPSSLGGRWYSPPEDYPPFTLNPVR